MSLVEKVRVLRRLVHLHAMRELLPLNSFVGEMYARAWQDGLRALPGVRSGRVEAVVRDAAASVLRRHGMRLCDGLRAASVPANDVAHAQGWAL